MSSRTFNCIINEELESSKVCDLGPFVLSVCRCRYGAGSWKCGTRTLERRLKQSYLKASAQRWQLTEERPRAES